jgi:hypothetical protein
MDQASFSSLLSALYLFAFSLTTVTYFAQYSTQTLHSPVRSQLGRSSPDSQQSPDLLETKAPNLMKQKRFTSIVWQLAEGVLNEILVCQLFCFRRNWELRKILLLLVKMFSPARLGPAIHQIDMSCNPKHPRYHGSSWLIRSPGPMHLQKGLLQKILSV